MLEEIIGYVKQHKKLYAFVFVMLMIAESSYVVPPLIIKNIIDAIGEKSLTANFLWYQLGIFVVVMIVSAITKYAWVKGLYGQSAKYQYDLRMKLFRKIVSMRLPFYEKFRSGDMMTRFTSDTTEYSSLLGFGIMTLLLGISTMTFTVMAMLWLSWQISILSIIPLVICGAIVVKVGNLQEEAIDESREAVANLSNEVLEVVEGIRVTRAYGKKATSFNRFKLRTKELAQKANKVTAYQAIYGRAANIFVAISTALIMGIGGYYMQQGQLALSDIVALQLYSSTLIGPMWLLSDGVIIYRLGKISFGKIQELLETSDDVEEDGDETLRELERIEWKNYSFRYPNAERHSLDNVSIYLDKGQTLGIVGKTGSGKTTLVRQLLRQYPVGEGEFLLNDKAVTSYQALDIMSHIGYVPQEHFLFSRSVKENIAFGRPEASQKLIDYAVAAASFTQDLARMQHGYDTLVGEKGVSISGGQKQRISIARAFIKEPSLLILDDSLSAVDARTERIIIENIQALRQDKTNIIVTHRLSAVSHADWIIVLDEGKIVQAGTPQQLLNEAGWYQEQYMRQQLEGESA